MNIDTLLCIKKYIKENFFGGLIGISDLAEYCKQSEGKIYVSLSKLEKQGEIQIIKRYFCPETHQIQNDSLPYCHECDYEYSEAYITTVVYVLPIKVKQEIS
jgi:hypothetical protein